MLSKSKLTIIVDGDVYFVIWVTVFSSALRQRRTWFNTLNTSMCKTMECVSPSMSRG